GARLRRDGVGRRIRLLEPGRSGGGSALPDHGLPLRILPAPSPRPVRGGGALARRRARRQGVRQALDPGHALARWGATRGSQPPLARVGGIGITIRETMEKHPERVIERAVRGMMPKTTLG